MATAQGNALQELCTVSDDKMLLPQCGKCLGDVDHIPDLICEFCWGFNLPSVLHDLTLNQSDERVST